MAVAVVGAVVFCRLRVGPNLCYCSSLFSRYFDRSNFAVVPVLLIYATATVPKTLIRSFGLFFYFTFIPTTLIRKMVVIFPPLYNKNILIGIIHTHILVHIYNKYYIIIRERWRYSYKRKFIYFSLPKN